MNEDQVFLGIDPGFYVTGYAIIKSVYAAPTALRRHSGFDAAETKVALATTAGKTTPDKREEKRTFLVECNYLKMNPKDSLVERVGIFYKTFHEKIEKHKATNIALETSFLSKNAQTFLKLGYLRGILYLLASQHSLKISEFAPREIKKSITGFGGASKEQVGMAMKCMFPILNKALKSARNDVTDALAIALCGVWKNSGALKQKDR